MTDPGFVNLAIVNPAAAEEALRREEWLHEMWKVLGPEALPAVEAWMVDKADDALDAALAHARLTGGFPPP